MKKSRTAALWLLFFLVFSAALAAGEGAISLKKAKILLPEDPAVYTGEPLTPEITVTLDGKPLTEGVDYTVEFSKNVDAGSGVVRVTGTGDYKGSVKRGFPIYRAENACEVSDLILPYSVEAQEAELSVYLQHEGKLSFSSNRKAVSVNRRGIVKIGKGFAGIAEITITAAESKNYKRLKKKAYVVCCETPEITDAFSRSNCSGRLSWTACKECSGYEIQIVSGDSVQEIRAETDPELGATEARVPLGPGGRYALSVRSVYTRGEMSFSSPWSEEAIVETPEEILLAGSDYVTPEGEVTWTAWRIGSDLFGRLMRAGVEPDRIVFCGDYSNRKAGAPGDTGKSIANLKEDMGIFFDDTKPNREELLIRGDLDRGAGPYAEDGPQETEHSIVYVLNADTANPARQGVLGATAENTLRASSAALRIYLAERAAANEHRPIIIATHVPLHWNGQTLETGDNLYSGILFDTLNEFGDALDIVYLFGHNLGAYVDSAIGGSRICRIPGETLLLPAPQPGENSTRRYRKEVLRFLYMNAGYMGACEKAYGEKGASAGVLTLYPDRIEISRGALKKAVADLSAAGTRPWESFPEDCLSVRRETVVIPRKQ